jgi:microcystin-dependent protein
MSTPYIGEIRMFGFGRVPTGWQACDGTLLSISEYDTLYSLLGTTFGGDGQSTFGVPDLRGRLPIHQGTGPGLSNYVMGQLAGTESVTLNQQQIPAHTHPMITTSAAATVLTPGNTLLPGAVSGDTLYCTDLTGAVAATMSPQSTTPSGNSQPHDNTMPTLTVQFCISLFGIYPSQG